MPEQGFERERSAGGGGKFAYLKLADKEKAIIRLLAVPTKYRQHWVDNRSRFCTKKETGSCEYCDDVTRGPRDRRPTERFGVPVYLHALSVGKDAQGKDKWEKMGEVRVWEQSGQTLDAIGAVAAEYEWKDTDMTITRIGVGTETKYTAMPRPKPQPVPDDVEIPDLMAHYTEMIEGQADSGQTLAEIAASNGAVPAAVGADDAPDYGDPFNE